MTEAPVNGGRNSRLTVGVVKFGYMLETLVESFFTRIFL